MACNCGKRKLTATQPKRVVKPTATTQSSTGQTNKSVSNRRIFRRAIR